MIRNNGFLIDIASRGISTEAKIHFAVQSRRFARVARVATRLYIPLVCFQIRQTNHFDTGDISGGSQRLDTFLLRELLDVSRVRVPRRDRRRWNLQRGIYSRCANN